MRLVSTAYSALLAVASAAPAQNNWRALNAHLEEFTAGTKDVLTIPMVKTPKMSKNAKLRWLSRPLTRWGGVICTSKRQIYFEIVVFITCMLGKVGPQRNIAL